MGLVQGEPMTGGQGWVLMVEGAIVLLELPTPISSYKNYTIQFLYLKALSLDWADLTVY